MEGDNGTLLIAMSGGIRQLVAGKIEAWPLPGIGRQFTPVRLLRDRDGGLWIGTVNLGLLHAHQGRTDLFTRADGLSGEGVLRLFEDREGNVWVATNGGLDRFRNFAVATISVKQGLSSDNVGSVLAARDGSVWLGTGDGLNRWNDGQITIYRKGNGLPDNAVESLFQDDRGRIWVSTRRAGSPASRMADLSRQTRCPAEKRIPSPETVRGISGSATRIRDCCIYSETVWWNGSPGRDWEGRTGPTLY